MGERTQIQAESASRSLPRSGTLQPSAMVPPIVHEVLYSPGQPLDAATRAHMESRFGHDFSRVRVHTDPASGQAARAIGAYAYTVNPHIYFAPGLYNSAHAGGVRLLAHELAHTIQQRDSASSVLASRPIDRPSAPLEREADKAAEAILSGTKPQVTEELSAPTLQLDGPEDRRHMARRPVEGGYIEVVRTLDDRPCRRVNRPESTAPGDILYFDPEANAFGIRYRYCSGSVETTLGSSLNYGRLRSDAQQLLGRLPRTALSGGDVLAEIRRTAEQTQLSAQAGIAVTVSGILRAEVRGRTEQGINAQEYQVEGLLRLAPSGDWGLEIRGGANIVRELGGQRVTFTFTPTVDIGPVQVGATVEHTRQEPVGAAPTRTTALRGTVSIPVTERLGFTLSGSAEGGGSFTISFGTIERPQRIRRVPEITCYFCDCPPPQPRYRCTRVRDPHTVQEVVQPASQESVQLHYNYDSDVPADRTLHQGQITRIVSLVDQNYAVRHIWGFASPEASEEYNMRLALRRAKHARTDIVSGLSEAGVTGAPSVPPAEGVGELLGRTTTGGGIRNVHLIRELSTRLSALNEEQQLELLGIDPRSLDETARAEMLERIQAFVRGTEGGRRLTTRARWEKIFPFLRRVEVVLDRGAITQPRRVPETRAPTDCDEETLRWALANMPSISLGRRLPASSGRC